MSDFYGMGTDVTDDRELGWEDEIEKEDDELEEEEDSEEELEDEESIDAEIERLIALKEKLQSK